MIDNSTLEIINYVADINQEYNTKLFILCLMLFYSLFMMWITRGRVARRFSDALFIVGAKTISFITLLNLPIMVILLYRGVKLETLIMIVLVLYSITIVLVIGFVQFWTFESVKRLFAWGAGWDIEKKTTVASQGIATANKIFFGRGRNGK